MKSKTDYILSLIKKFPDTSKRRLGMIANSERPDLFDSPESARSSIRFVFGKRGEKMSKYKKVEDNQRKGSKVYTMPKSKAKDYKPYKIKAKTVAILCDIHFPKHSEKALKIAVENILKNGEPDVLILNGDIADAEEFSNWSKNPRALDAVDSLDKIRKGFLWIRDKFKNSKIIYKAGNHEERLDRYCWSKAPELVGLPHISWEGLIKIDNQLNRIEELQDIVFISDQRPISLGKLFVFHGHELPKIGSNVISPARSAFLKTFDSVLIGHHHQCDTFTQYDWKHDPIKCWSVGCLCSLNADYAPINKWSHGHAIVELTNSGNFKLHNYRHLKNGAVEFA